MVEVVPMVRVVMLPARAERRSRSRSAARECLAVINDLSAYFFTFWQPCRGGRNGATSDQPRIVMAAAPPRLSDSASGRYFGSGGLSRHVMATGPLLSGGATGSDRRRY